MQEYELKHPWQRRINGADVPVNSLAVPDVLTVEDMLDVPFTARNKLLMVQAILRKSAKLGQFDLSKLHLEDANGYLERIQDLLSSDPDAPLAWEPPDYKPVVSVMAEIDADMQTEPVRYWALLFIKFGKPRDFVMKTDFRHFNPIMQAAQKKMSG